MLLRRMADYQPERVDGAMAELSAGPTEMRDANRHWQALSRARGAPTGLTRLRMALGEPIDRRTRALGEVTVQLIHWRLPLWPDLWFQAVATESGHVWEQLLVRPDPATAPELASLADLVPWSCVIGDVDRAFPGGTHLEGDAASRWGLRLTAPGADGNPVVVTAQFVWGLLQRVVVADP